MDFESTTLGFTFQCSPSRASGSDVGMFYPSDIEAHRLVYDQMDNFMSLLDYYMSYLLPTLLSTFGLLKQFHLPSERMQLEVPKSLSWYIQAIQTKMATVIFGERELLSFFNIGKICYLNSQPMSYCVKETSLQKKNPAFLKDSSYSK